MKRNAGKLALLLAVGGCLLMFSTSSVWAQAVALSPEGYNEMLESYGLKLIDPSKAPMEYVTVKDGKNIFGTTPIAYTPEGYNAMLECYGLKLTDPSKAPMEFVAVKDGKNVFGTSPIAYDPADQIRMLEAYGVKTSK